MRGSKRYEIGFAAAIAALALAGCGSSHSAPASTRANIDTTASAAPAPLPSTPAPTATATTAPAFSGDEAAAFKKACGYFSGDLGALTGELKMSNLTGGELTAAAQYVAEDLNAVERHLSAAGKHQVARSLAVLVTAERTSRSHAVSSQESRSLGLTFASAPFTRLSTLVAAACRP